MPFEVIILLINIAVTLLNLCVMSKETKLIKRFISWEKRRYASWKRLYEEKEMWKRLYKENKK